MAKRLFIGSISWDTTEESLEAAFSQAGTVVSKAIIKDQDGRSKGFGFVEMATEEEAQKAIEMWNGKELDGRAIAVNEAREREDRGPRSSGGYGGGRSGGYNRDSR